MLRELKDQYLHEDTALARYAIHNMHTQGRRFPEKPHPLRTDFQRDRDRVLHSRAFRRLEYKTQVFLNGAGDHYRTRLTHTIEVAAICRTIARALCLNEDLSETIALAHDLGHTPFGHAGERAMNVLMKDYGGFDHNLQAFRVVDMLEIKYPEYDGINLTWEVRTGLIKHRTGKKSMLDGKELPPQPSMEAQIADVGDDLTYYGHDVDDGLDAGLINEKMLSRIEVWELAAQLARKNGLKDGSDRFRAFAVRCLIDMMVSDVVNNSCRNIEKFNIKNPMDAQNCSEQIITFSPDFKRMTDALREFLYENIYFHKKIEKINNIAVERMKKLFELYVKEPELMGDGSQIRIESEGVHRAAADYVAGMTDRFAMHEYKRYFRK